MPRDLEYEKNNIGSDSQFIDGIKCKNYEICECILPNWWFECKGKYLCTNCDMQFGNDKGILEIKDNIECPICLEEKKGICQPKCDHYLCIDCFKRCYYGDDSKEGEPSFPYPDIEEEYYDDQENPKWDNEYPLIEIFNLCHNDWDDERIAKYEKEIYLRICPLCRK